MFLAGAVIEVAADEIWDLETVSLGTKNLCGAVTKNLGTKNMYGVVIAYIWNLCIIAIKSRLPETG